MSDSGENPFLIMPPPGVVPAADPEPEKVEPLNDATALISLPPGVETVTYKMTPTRGVEPTQAPTASPNFFPTPGTAILPTAPPAEVPPPPAPSPEDEPARAPQPRLTETATPPPAPVVEPVEPEPTPLPEPAPSFEIAPSFEVTQASEVTQVPPPQAVGPQWRLLMPHGDEPVVLAGALVIGRSPVTIPEYSQAQLVKASDPSRSVSKTHALLGIDGTGLWVADLGSTNGTFVITPSGGDVKVQPGAPVYVPSGSDIELGQYVIQVEQY